MSVNKPTQKITCPLFIDGQETKGSGETLSVVSPYFGDVIADLSTASVADVDKAVASAAKAQKSWGALPLKERTRVMFKFREILMERAEEISHTISLESGKTLKEAYAGLMKGVEVLEYALSLQNIDIGGKMEVSRGVFCEYRRMPLGVTANITPFNFPAMVPMWTIPLSLTLGNAYLWKPSEKTPLTSLHLSRALKDSGLPDGLFQVLHGGETTVNAIIDHPEVKAIGFVGSSKIAGLLYARATALGKRALCLGGAKNHIVLLPDANPELTGPGISDSFTGCAGQRCMAASVVLAVGNVEHHIQQIIKRAASLKLGEEMGALITKAQKDFLCQAIERAVKEGAKILLDGRDVKAPKGYEGGHWLGPTILDNIKPGSEAATKELFGPLLSIIRCQTINEAMEIENSSEYGNACSVFTSSGALSEKVISMARAGMIGVNIGVPVPREPFSFGGIQASRFGHGDITGSQGVDFWTQLKKLTTKWEAQTDHTWMS